MNLPNLITPYPVPGIQFYLVPGIDVQLMAVTTRQLPTGLYDWCKPIHIVKYSSEEEI